MRYKFCHQLKNNIFFANNEIIHCCAGSESIAPKFRSNYFGEIFSGEELIKEKVEAQNRAKSGMLPFSSCKNCFSYEENDWDDDCSIKDISISHWTACNCNCFYCYSAKDKEYFNSRKPYDLLPVLENIKSVISPDCKVRFIGGDVAMLKEFDDLIKFFSDLGVKDFYVPTSGIKFLNVLENLLSKGLARAIISLDAGDRETYKKIKQVDCFEKVVENMQKYVAAAKVGGAVFEAKYIIIPNVNDTFEQVQKWLDLCVSMGIKNVGMDFETNYLVNCPDKIPDNAVKLEEFVEKTASENGMKYCRFTYLSQLVHGLENGLYRFAGENEV